MASRIDQKAVPIKKITAMNENMLASKIRLIQTRHWWIRQMRNDPSLVEGNGLSHRISEHRQADYYSPTGHIRIFSLRQLVT
ncbi:hypothetical protein CBP15_12545 [Fischerella thermalis WC442]|jgi:hypothetical protein|nr:hypothetical protein CBP15_12545 [Fischerella thermalis WC442]